VPSIHGSSYRRFHRGVEGYHTSHAAGVPSKDRCHGQTKWVHCTHLAHDAYLYENHDRNRAEMDQFQTAWQKVMSGAVTASMSMNIDRLPGSRKRNLDGIVGPGL